MVARFFILVFFWQHAALHSLADISFIVIDLKYNKEQGVKICELQPGANSRFSGFDALERKEHPDIPSDLVNVIPKMYSGELAKYGVPVCFVGPIYGKMRREFQNRKWTSIVSPRVLFSMIQETPVDVENLFTYQYFVFSTKSMRDLISDEGAQSRILFLDHAIAPYTGDKYQISQLFDADERIRDLRPHWNLYLKGSSKELVEKIVNEIPGDRVVIKPVHATMGRGVIIIDKKDLQSTLKYIFETNKGELIEDMDRSYSWYASDENDCFMVEEFVGSDPLIIPEGGNLPYDCTMRVVAILSYQQKVAEVSFLGGYWYSPRKPIGASNSLNESHKAKGTFYLKVDVETLDAVEGELLPRLLILYHKMLGL